jgi:hypothetical protein
MLQSLWMLRCHREDGDTPPPTYEEATGKWRAKRKSVSFGAQGAAVPNVSVGITHELPPIKRVYEAISPPDSAAGSTSMQQQCSLIEGGWFGAKMKRPTVSTKKGPTFVPLQKQQLDQLLQQQQMYGSPQLLLNLDGGRPPVALCRHNNQWAIQHTYVLSTGTQVSISIGNKDLALQAPCESSRKITDVQLYRKNR